MKSLPLNNTYPVRQIPALVIGYNQPDAFLSRINELSQQYTPIYLFVDGYSGYDSAVSSENSKVQEIAIQSMALGKVHQIEISSNSLGQAVSIPRAIEWFLREVNFGLIVEDDCQIHEDLYDFLFENKSLLLDSKSKVSAICGSNIADKRKMPIFEHSIESSFFETWGWATTLDKWLSCYNPKIGCNEIIQSIQFFNNLTFSQKFLFKRAMVKQFRVISSGVQKTWAFWFFWGSVVSGQKCLYPIKNLVLHHSSMSAVHVQKTPKWYEKVRFDGLPSMLDHSLINNSIYFDRYTVVNMYGATAKRALRGAIFRLRKK